MSLRTQLETNKTAFFSLWISINTGGLMLSMVIIGSLQPVLASITSPDAAPYIGFFIIGSAIGFLQWLLLRLQFLIVWYKWIVATTIGFGLGLSGFIWAALLDRYIVPLPPGPTLQWDSLIGGLLLGLAVGCCQSLVGWSHLRHIFGWIVANVVGWSLGLFLAHLLAYFLLYELVAGSTAGYVSLIFSGGWFSVVTGIALVWLAEWCEESNGRFTADPAVAYRENMQE
jgi:hypothetical protein